jgi:Protein of unknown function (DUF4058)
MPLRDHFHAPLDDLTSWEAFHAQWPAMMVLSLARELPRRYVANPRVHAGAIEVDVGTFDEEEKLAFAAESSNGGGMATAVWAAPRPTLAVATDRLDLDEYEVRVYDVKRGRRLVAAIEFVSPANKDRPEHRDAFVAKCVALLQNRVSVIIVDLVTSRQANLYADLLDFLGQTDPSLIGEPPPLYAVACRAIRPADTWQLETWLHVLQLGQPLPTLPLWLAENFSVPLELEESYESTCKALRIP